MAEPALPTLAAGKLIQGKLCLFSFFLMCSGYLRCSYQSFTARVPLLPSHYVMMGITILS